MDLAFVWALLIAFAILAYVVLDGFDLGVGILFAYERDEACRDVMVNTVAPVWDGNETWLVLGGGGLLAAFPLAYAVIMPALYPLIIAMLLALVFRGVAFEFRSHSRSRKDFWNFAFFGGSALAAIAQGLALGAFVQGIAVDGRAYAGGWFDWLSPFSIMTAAALVAGYALLGATWLVLKTTGKLQAAMYRAARVLTIVLAAFMVTVSLWMVAFDAAVAERWLSWPNVVLLAPLPTLAAMATGALFLALARRRERSPFPLALALFVLNFVGLGVGLYPYIVPRAITIWRAAAPDDSLLFLLVGASILLPMILGYTGYAYWVFRGKVREGEGYH